MPVTNDEAELLYKRGLYLSTIGTKQSEPFASVDESDRIGDFVEIRERKELLEAWNRVRFDRWKFIEARGKGLERKEISSLKSFLISVTGSWFFFSLSLSLSLSLFFFSFSLVSFVSSHCTLFTHRSIVKFRPIEFMCR